MIHLLSFEPYITSLASVVFALEVLATFEFEMDLCAWWVPGAAPGCCLGSAGFTERNTYQMITISSLVVITSALSWTPYALQKCNIQGREAQAKVDVGKSMEYGAEKTKCLLEPGAKMGGFNR